MRKKKPNNQWRLEKRPKSDTQTREFQGRDEKREVVVVVV